MDGLTGAAVPIAGSSIVYGEGGNGVYNITQDITVMQKGHEALVDLCIAERLAKLETALFEIAVDTERVTAVRRSFAGHRTGMIEIVDRHIIFSGLGAAG